MEVLTIMCDRCVNDKRDGIKHLVFEWKDPNGMKFWGCPHLAIVWQEAK